MAQWLKQSTAFTFRIGPFVDSTDGFTAETALTLSQADFRLSKAGGAFAQKNETTSGTHDENGYYTCILNTTDTNTLGTLDIHVNESGALPVFKSFMVVPAMIYDSIVAGTDRLDTNVTHAIDVAWASGAITAASIATNAIDADALATDAVTEIWNGNPNLVRTATAQGGTANSITLDASASATNGLYDPSLIVITGGTGAGQARLMTDYNGTTKVAIVNRDWRVTPDNTSVFRILAAPNLVSLNEGLAQGGGATTITLNALASATDNIYNGQCVWITTGTGQDQLRLITAYNGTTKVATVDAAWVTNPTSSSGYMLIPQGRSLVAAMNADTVTASAIAADAIGSSELAATAASEIATAVRTELATELGRIDAATSTRLASASYTAPDNATIGTTATAVTAIKAKTDQLTFTKANELDANIQSINDTTITGNGASPKFGV